MPRCPLHTIAWSAEKRDTALDTRSDARTTHKSFTTEERQEATRIAVACAAEGDKDMSAGIRQSAAGSAGIGDEEDYSLEEEEEQEDVEETRKKVLPVARRAVYKTDESSKLLNLEFLAQGGYHHVWLVTFLTICGIGKIGSSSVEEEKEKEKKLVLRTPKKPPTLQPYKLRNEAACLEFLAKQKPSIPAPRLYTWDDGTSGSGSGSAFIAEEYIEGQRLSATWLQLDEQEKSDIIREIANVIADLGETRFQCIGGLSTSSLAGPTIESAKIYNGRAKFHSQDCYNIGPYANSKDYILSCYDREIYFYAHADQSEIMEEAFEDTSVAEFVARLKVERQALLDNNESQFQAIDAEPLVLVHEDFHAGNMLVRDGHLVGVVDWEFSGVYPLSELFATPDILMISSPDRNETTEREELEWHDRYLQEFDKVVRQRGWREEDRNIARGEGHKILGKARAIMFPND